MAATDTIDLAAIRRANQDQRDYCERHFPAHDAGAMRSPVSINEVDALLALVEQLRADCEWAETQRQQNFDWAKTAEDRAAAAEAALQSETSA